MYTSPSQTITSAATLTFANPSLVRTSTPAVTAQIANLSGWSVQALTENGAVLIQPFTAASIPTGPAQNCMVTPVNQTYAVGVNQVSVSWMIEHEQPPQPDGPLTAAAVAATAPPSSGQAANTGIITLAASSFATITPAPPAGQAIYVQSVDTYIDVISGTAGIFTVQVGFGTTPVNFVPICAFTYNGTLTGDKQKVFPGLAKGSAGFPCSLKVDSNTYTVSASISLCIVTYGVGP